MLVLNTDWYKHTIIQGGGGHKHAPAETGF
jgi:hypothetical protein